MSVNLVVALAAEARPIIDAFALQRQQGAPFVHYQGDGVQLLQTGIGKLNAAAATAWLGARQSQTSSWLNVGVAGHRSLAVGSVIRATKITDRASSKHWFPIDVLALPSGRRRFEGQPVITVDVVESQYAEAAAYDMEASGFFHAASRFASAELVQSIKVISDGPAFAVDRVTKDSVSQLVANAVDIVDAMVDALIRVEQQLPIQVTPDLTAWVDRWRVSTTQQHRLRRALHRYQVRFSNECGSLFEEFAVRYAANAPANDIIAAIDERLAKPIALEPLIESPERQCEPST